MSLGASGAVWDDERLDKPGIVLVMLAIADHAWPTGWAFPSVDTIAKKARITPRRCYDLLSWLEDEGHLVIISGGGWKGTHLYGITAITKGEFAPPTPSEIYEAMLSKRVPRRHAKGEKTSPPLKKLHPALSKPKTSPEPEVTSTHTNNGAVEWPSEEEVKAAAKSYPGNLAKGIPAVIPESWASKWWGYQTYTVRSFGNDWKPQMVWRFEREWQDGHPAARSQLQNKNTAPQKPASDEKLTFGDMRLK